MKTSEKLANALKERFPDLEDVQAINYIARTYCGTNQLAAWAWSWQAHAEDQTLPIGSIYTMSDCYRARDRLTVHRTYGGDLEVLIEGRYD